MRHLVKGILFVLVVGIGLLFAQTSYSPRVNPNTGNLEFCGDIVLEGALRVTSTSDSYFTGNGKFGIGTLIPNAKLDVHGTPGATVGGFASGHFQVTNSSASVNANSVITGHNSNVGNKQLWYLGSTSSSNDNIAFINRQNGSVSFSTSNVIRMTIASSSGKVGIGTSGPARQLHVVGDMRLTSQTSPPASASIGDIYTDTSGALCFYDGVSWKVAAGVGSCS